jgi:hypothetical protein
MRNDIEVRFRISKPGRIGWMKPAAETHICVFASMARRRTVELDEGSVRPAMAFLIESIDVTKSIVHLKRQRRA